MRTRTALHAGLSVLCLLHLAAAQGSSRANDDENDEDETCDFENAEITFTEPPQILVAATLSTSAFSDKTFSLPTSFTNVDKQTCPSTASFHRNISSPPPLPPSPLLVLRTRSSSTEAAAGSGASKAETKFSTAAAIRETQPPYLKLPKLAEPGSMAGLVVFFVICLFLV